MSWGIASRRGVALAGLAAVMAAAPGCVWIRASMLKVPPSAEKLLPLAPSDRHGVACRIPWVLGKLRRDLPYVLKDPKEKKNGGYADGIARVAFMPMPGLKLEGPRAYPLMVFSAFDVIKIVYRRHRQPLARWTFSIPEGSDCVDVIPELKLQTLLEARRGSPFFRVAKARYGGTECAAVTDCVPIRGRLHRTVELYSGDPRASPRPDHVLLASVADPSGKNWGPGPVDAFAAGGKVFRMRPPDWGESGPSEVVFDEFSLKFDDIIDLGKLEFLPRAMGLQAAISYGNNFLLEWKTKTMPGRLRAASVAELEGLVIRIEKAVLRYDMAAKEVKDLAAAALAKGADVSGRLRVARLTEQHVDILASILAVTKRVLAAKRKAR